MLLGLLQDQRTDSQHFLSSVGGGDTRLGLSTDLCDMRLPASVHGIRMVSSAKTVLRSGTLALTSRIKVHPGDSDQMRTANEVVFHGFFIALFKGYGKSSEGVEPSQSALGRLTLVPPARTLHVSFAQAALRLLTPSPE